MNDNCIKCGKKCKDTICIICDFKLHYTLQSVILDAQIAHRNRKRQKLIEDIAEAVVNKLRIKIEDQELGSIIEERDSEKSKAIKVSLDDL